MICGLFHRIYQEGNTMSATTKSTTKERAGVKTAVDTRTEISKGALVSMTAAGVIIGLWAFAALISAMVLAGGPVALIKAWFGAVTGM